MGQDQVVLYDIYYRWNELCRLRDAHLTSEIDNSLRRSPRMGSKIMCVWRVALTLTSRHCVRLVHECGILPYFDGWN